MGQPYISLNDSQQFAQDAVDMIDFAKGNATTPYGKERAVMGHPAPFKFTRMEVRGMGCTLQQLFQLLSSPFYQSLSSQNGLALYCKPMSASLIADEPCKEHINAASISNRLLSPASPFFYQVGNEERLMNTPDYPDHYRLITGAIWEKDPSMQVC